MTATEVTPRTVDEALERFELINGAGSETQNTACAMTALAWVAGDAWTDRPPCANRLLAMWVIGANDAAGTTVAQRQAIVREGATGVIDTWWIPDIVLLDIWRSSEGATRADRVIDVVKRVAAWKAQPNRQRPVLSDAVLSDADLRGADLRGAVLRGADLRGAVLSDADLSDADLRDAVLSDADLRGAVLRGADLRGAWRPHGDVPAGWGRDANGRLARAVATTTTSGNTITGLARA